MYHRSFIAFLIFTAFMLAVSPILHSQVKYIEVNINQPGLADCLAINIDESPENDMKVNIYPNPNEGDFIVDITHIRPMNNVIIGISDMNGIELHSEKLKGEALHFRKELHLPNLSKGLYLVTVRFDQDKCVRRLIIL